MIKENVVVLLTNCDTQANLKVSDVGLDILPCRVFKIQNSIFSADPKNPDKNVIIKNNENYQASIDVLKSMLDKCLTMNVQKNTSFIELKQQRE